MKHCFTTLFILLTFSIISIAQSNYKEGYLVTIQGDTLKGHIDYREWNNNPQSIYFKSLVNGKDKQEFTPETSKYFEIEDLEAYQQYNGWISTDNVDVRRLPTFLDTSRVKANVFLKVIQKGKHLSLLSYTDQAKTRFFIQETGSSKIQELVYRRYLDPNNSKIIVSKLYLGQLWLAAVHYNVSSENLKRSIETARYEESDLLPIVSKINGIDNKQQKQDKSSSNNRFFAGIAFNRSQIDVSGKHAFASDATSNPSYQPKVSLGVDAFINPNVQRLVLRVEASYSKVNANILTSERSLLLSREYIQAFNQQVVTLTPQVIYNLYNKEKFKFNIGGGIAANYATYSDINYSAKTSLNADGTVTTNILKKDNLILKKYLYTFPVRAGIVFNDKVELCATYVASTSLTKYIEYSFNCSSSYLQINYFFTKPAR